MQYDIYISYSAEDEKLAGRVTDYLEHYNISCFLACRDLPAGIPWSQGIAEGIEQSRMAIVVYSDCYNNASWLDDEAMEIKRSEKPVLAFAITNSGYSEAKGECLKNAPCIGAVGNIYDAFPYVYETACNILGMPIESTEPAETILKDLDKDNAPAEETVAEESPKQASAPVERKAERQSEERNSSRDNAASAGGNKGASLLTAALIGVSITAAVILLLEWLLA